MLVPHVVRLGLRAPRDVASRWDRYWADVEATGDDGDVLWDSSGDGEAQRYLELLSTHADRDLPLIDVGCGNGRFTRALAAASPRAVGVDLSAHAVDRARSETSDPAVSFRVADMTAPDAARPLVAELGACNVFVRGVLHVLDPPARRALASNLGDLLGPRGTLVIAETNYGGSLLGYLESLGGGPTGLPRPLARAISAGIPRPASFGRRELDDAFPPSRWDHVVTDDHATITTVPMRRAATGTVPGHLAVVRLRDRAPGSPGSAGRPRSPA